MEIRIVTSNIIDQWNAKSPNPMQSWQWGEARKQMGIEVLRIGEFNKDRLENTYQLTFHKIPYTNLKIGYLPRSVFPSKKTLEFIANYCIKKKVIFVKIEPYIFKSQLPNSNLQTNFKFQTSNFKIVQSPHPLFPQWSQILNLQKSEDDLLKSMHHKTRYNIRLAQKKGVVIKEMSDDKGFNIFIKLYFDTCKRQKYFGHNPQYHKIIWNHLKKNIAHILIAFYKDEPLVAYELFYFNKVLYYPYGGSSELHRNLMAANLIMWESIKLGKKLGADYFDMWGSLPKNYNLNDLWSGFTRFKEGYGTEFVEFIGSYDLVINNLQYSIFNCIDKLKRLYLKLKRLF